MMDGPLKTAQTPALDMAYHESGPERGTPVLLLHGFPYDVHAYQAVAPLLAASGCRVIVPFLRGYGPTRFRDPATPRSGQQAALGIDVRELMDTLGIEKAVLAGYDWGGRGACIVAALWPQRVLGLVTAEGYNIQDIPASIRPAPAEQEWRLWYQYYFHTARGEAGLRQDRRDVCRLLWRLWSPSWAFDDATFARTAAAFDNPDWVDVVVQSYRHRFAYAPGDPALEPIEQALQRQPPIPVPAVVLHGLDDGVAGPEAHHDLRKFTGPVRSEAIPGTGHNVPQEAPAPFARAVLSLIPQP
jgi:pimeloyl-ACP methyl ester carboxylesterase